MTPLSARELAHRERLLQWLGIQERSAFPWDILLLPHHLWQAFCQEHSYPMDVRLLEPWIYLVETTASGRYEFVHHQALADDWQREHRQKSQEIDSDIAGFAPLWEAP